MRIDTSGNRPLDRRALASLTPLIDVVFILLVFFMLASRFSDRRMIELHFQPEMRATTRASGPAALLKIGRKGAMQLNGERVTALDLTQKVMNWTANDPYRRYFIQPDEDANAQQIVTAIDLLTSSGARNVILTHF